MGFLRDLFLGPAAQAVTGGLLSWYSPQDSIHSLFVADALPVAPDAVTRDTAFRVPAVDRAHDVICSVIADMPWFTYQGDTRKADQPEWLTNTKTGIPPYDLRWAVCSDLFMSGWAAIGFELGADGLPADALHIPRALWSLDPDGGIRVNAKIDPRYRQRVVPIRLGYGKNGMLVDALGDIKAARTIADAYRDRIDNPIAQTVLTVDKDVWDEWDWNERELFRQKWIEARSAAGGAVAMKPTYVEVDVSGAIPTDLFETGRNANRLDLANHAGLPASMLEGVRQGGSGGGTEMRYTGVQNGAQRNEVWDFGIRKYAAAIAARLSLDDVCAPGESIRVDTSRFLTVPTPPEQQTSED
ncbi:hypothetical protein [Microbacterium soli]|uniref:Phage portal protein n=1 Tax=Microbacterium soli TaxID=446075 RepID=A0ABP7NKA2_9MICO